MPFLYVAENINDGKKPYFSVYFTYLLIQASGWSKGLRFTSWWRPDEPDPGNTGVGTGGNTFLLDQCKWRDPLSFL
jgi:hypothetical protein